MYVFIAGATKIGLFNIYFPSYSLTLKSQALNTHVNRLSHIPFTILAKVLADKGAMIK